ncbi:MAG: flagellar biosynthetic protein FliO [candidate division Zixibacteria bacterium]|nr:flagellar biosynthetic protein FliO [candidate division Zixibacteria bacterium]
MRKTLIAITIPLSILMSNGVWADQIDFMNKGANSGPNFASLLVRLVLALVLIVGLIYASMYALKRFSYTGKKKLAGSNIEILQRSYLAPKKGIYIVKVQSKILVLGVTDNNINLLTELPELADEKGNPQNPFSNPGDKSKNFSDLMQEMKGKFNSLWQKRGKDAV